MRYCTRRAFTLRDLCVALCLLALIATAGIRAVHSASGGSNRLTCASKLRQIGQAIAIYAAVNAGQYPRTVFDGTPDPVPTEYTGALASDPFAAGGPAPNDVTAPLFLLVRDGIISPDVFVCPSSDAIAWDYDGGKPTTRSNFPGRSHLSYGYTNVYPGDAALKAGFKLKVMPPASDFAIAADMGSGPVAASVASDAPRAEIILANSRNHGGDGQNVLYEDGHVDWSATPYCGAGRPITNAPRDNIYAYGIDAPGKLGGGTRGAPLDQYDSVILPTADAGPQPSRAAVFLRQNETLLWGIVMVLLIGVVAVTALLLLVRAFGGRRGSAAAASRV